MQDFIYKIKVIFRFNTFLFNLYNTNKKWEFSFSLLGKKKKAINCNGDYHSKWYLLNLFT